MSSDPIQAVPPGEAEELRALARAIQLSKGFALLFVQCSSPSVVQKQISALREMMPDLRLWEVEVRHPIHNLLPVLRSELQPALPDAVFVTGFERWVRSDGTPERLPLVRNLNATRESLAKLVAGPLVLWAPEYVIVAIRRGAPDFFSVNSGVYSFAAGDRDTAPRTAGLLEARLDEIAAFPRDEKLARTDALEKLVRKWCSLPEADRDQPALARTLISLAGLYRDSARYGDARRSLEQALEIAESVYGPTSMPVALLVNNLGDVLQDLGDLAGAKSAFERALKIGEAVYGPDHPAVAKAANNLGSALRALGDLSGAKSAFERALKIDEAVYGPDHPTVAIRVNNLGLVLEDLGDLAGARSAFERALTIDEAVYGPDHPGVATYVNNLGGVLEELGDVWGAKSAFERALRIDEAVYGPDHPNVAVRVNNVGNVLQAMGDLSGARAAYERALKVYEAVFGPDHPAVANAANNLGSAMRALGDLSGARSELRRALVIFEKFLPPEHSSIARVRRNLEIVESELRKQREGKRKH